MLSTSLVSAAGIERSAIPTSVLFEEGRYLQFSASTANPTVEGDYTDALGGGSTDDMAQSFRNFGAAYKADLTSNLSYGIFLNQPYGANASYTNGIYDGLKAEWNSGQVTVLVKYTSDTNLSFYGGARYVQSKADIFIPDTLIRGPAAAEAQSLQAAAEDIVNNQIPAQLAPGGNPALIPGLIAEATALGAEATAIAAQNDLINQPFGSIEYEANGDWDGQFGAILGVAYERPDIALRVGLTWEQGVTHEFDTSESFGDFFDTGDGKTEVDMPQSITLDFQTGVAPETLVFGSVKWTEWSVWEVRTPQYEELTGRRVTGIDNDAFTYKLGVGRAINDDLSVFGQVTYEPDNGDELSRLAPTDGRYGIGFGASYTYENVKFTGGIEYSRLGSGTDSTDVKFADSDVLGIGMTIGYSF